MLYRLTERWTRWTFRATASIKGPGKEKSELAVTPRYPHFRQLDGGNQGTRKFPEFLLAGPHAGPGYQQNRRRVSGLLRLPGVPRKFRKISHRIA